MNKTAIMSIVAFLLVAMPIAIAQEQNATNQTTEIHGGKEYPLLERALDRIKLAFTFQIERKLALIAKIEQRREEHYQFLLAQGKTDQANAFKSRTTGLEKNFEQWKTKKNATIQRFENKTQMVREKAQRSENRTQITHTAPTQPAKPAGRGGY